MSFLRSSCRRAGCGLALLMRRCAVAWRGGLCGGMQIKPAWSSSYKRNVYLAVRRARIGDARLDAAFDGKVRAALPCRI